MVYRDFWKMSQMVFSLDSIFYPSVLSLSFIPAVLLLASSKVNLFSEIFLENPNLDGSCISLTAFLSRINLKLENIYVPPKINKTGIICFDSSHMSLINWNTVVVLKNRKPKLSYEPMFPLFFEATLSSRLTEGLVCRACI